MILLLSDFLYCNIKHQKIQYRRIFSLMKNKDNIYVLKEKKCYCASP